jgi:hypothetical protein
VQQTSRFVGCVVFRSVNNLAGTRLLNVPPVLLAWVTRIGHFHVLQSDIIGWNSEQPLVNSVGQPVHMTTTHAQSERGGAGQGWRQHNYKEMYRHNGLCF